jgi:hypothetical protein
MRYVYAASHIRACPCRDIMLGCPSPRTGESASSEIKQREFLPAGPCLAAVPPDETTDKENGYCKP